MTYIALLRAVNVGGRTVKMDQLKQLFTDMGFTRVRTYIQSGNVFFDTEESDPARLADRIEQHLEKTLGFAVPTFVYSMAKIEEMVSTNPFSGVEATENTRFCAVFTKDTLLAGLSLPYSEKQGGTEYTIQRILDGVVFVVMNQADGKPGNAAAFVEKKLGVRATSRFFHTTKKILKAAKA